MTSCPTKTMILRSVLPPRDYSNIVKLQQENILDQFLEHPTTAALETITGAFAGGGKGLFVSAGRIAQGLVKGQIYDVLADEIRRLREAGKLPDNLGETKRGLYTWAELCAIIDSECPDADRMEALKAAFYNVNKVSQEDDAQIFTYQLWQIAKKLESADVILLKAVHEKNAQLSGLVDLQWANQTAAVSGLGSAEIVQNCIDRTRATQSDLSHEREQQSGIRDGPRMATYPEHPDLQYRSRCCDRREKARRLRLTSPRSARPSPARPSLKCPPGALGPALTSSSR